MSSSCAIRLSINRATVKRSTWMSSCERWSLYSSSRVCRAYWCCCNCSISFLFSRTYFRVWLIKLNILSILWYTIAVSFSACFTARRISVTSLWVATPKTAFPASPMMSTSPLFTRLRRRSRDLEVRSNTASPALPVRRSKASSRVCQIFWSSAVVRDRTVCIPRSHFLYPRPHGYHRWRVDDD